MKITVYPPENPTEAISIYRMRRVVRVGDATLLVVAGLARPAWLVKSDAIAAA